jgi:hypothetical protein
VLLLTCDTSPSGCTEREEGGGVQDRERERERVEKLRGNVM